LKICLFTPSFLPSVGGMEAVVGKLASEFHSAGHEVLVLAKLARSEQPMPELGYEVGRYRRTRSNLYFLGPASRALRKEHARRNFDIIHCHSIYPNGYVAAKLKAKLRSAVVVTCHGGDLRRFSRKLLARHRLRWTALQADATTCVSAGLKQSLDNLVGMTTQACVIPNGVDPAVAPPDRPCEAFSELAKSPFLLTLGRLHRYKGLDVLLNALAIMQNDGLTPPTVVIAGEGKEGDNLRSLAKTLGVNDSVHFVGNVQGNNKSWLLANCLFFLQPSRQEGMPLTVLEAMAYGKAVLGTKITGTEELVTDGLNGALVSPEDAGSLAKAICRLTPGGTLRELGKHAKSLAQRMSWHSIAERYLELFEGIRSV